MRLKKLVDEGDTSPEGVRGSLRWVSASLLKLGDESMALMLLKRVLSIGFEITGVGEFDCIAGKYLLLWMNWHLDP